MSVAASRVDFEGNVSSMSDAIFTPPPDHVGGTANQNIGGNVNLGLGERACSAAGAAVLSVILVNPLDVVKTRLQAQAVGVNATGYICARRTAFGVHTYHIAAASVVNLILIQCSYTNTSATTSAT